jgi:hypothetical protein
MIKLLARFSPRLQAALDLPKEVAEVFVAVEDVIHSQASDPKVQALLNDIHDLQRKLVVIRGN